MIPGKPEDARHAIIQVLAALKPDILGIEEIGAAAEIYDLQARLKKEQLDLPFYTTVEGGDTVRHIALLSRFPILSVQSKALVPFEIGGVRHLMQRGILDASIDLPGLGAVHFIGLHLKSKIEAKEFDQATFRGREAIEVRRHINRLFEAEPNARIVLWGDFNMTKNDRAFREIAGPVGKATSLMPVALADSQGYFWTHYWAAADQYARIDYILLSTTVNGKVLRKQSGIAEHPNWLQASDHRPLYLKLQCN